MTEMGQDDESEPWCSARTTEADDGNERCDIDVIITQEFEEAWKDEVDLFFPHVEVSLRIVDPSLADCPVIAVSDNFEKITGYRRRELVGKSCRFLSEGCPLDWESLMRWQAAQATGAPETAIVVNQRKTGELFESAISTRGFVGVERLDKRSEGVHCTPAEKMLLAEMHVDITNIEDESLRERFVDKFHLIADRIRTKALRIICGLAVEGVEDQEEATLAEGMAWRTLSKPYWK